MLEKVLNRDNLNRVHKRIRANKGASGVDGMTGEEALISNISNRNPGYVTHGDLMPIHDTVGALKADGFRVSYGTTVLDHLTTDGAGLTGGQVAIVAVLQVDTNLGGCTFYILNRSSYVRTKIFFHLRFFQNAYIIGTSILATSMNLHTPKAVCNLADGFLHLCT